MKKKNIFNLNKNIIDGSGVENVWSTLTYMLTYVIPRILDFSTFKIFGRYILWPCTDCMLGTMYKNLAITRNFSSESRRQFFFYQRLN